MENGSDRSTGRRLWFALLAPPIAWTLAELAGWAVVTRTCGAGTGVQTRLETLQWIVLLAIPTAAGAIAVTSLVLAWRAFRRSSGSMRLREAEGVSRVEFMAVAGVIVSLLLLLNIIYFGVMPLFVDPCQRVI